MKTICSAGSVRWGLTELGCCPVWPHARPTVSMMPLLAVPGMLVHVQLNAAAVLEPARSKLFGAWRDLDELYSNSSCSIPALLLTQVALAGPCFSASVTCVRCAVQV